MNTKNSNQLTPANPSLEGVTLKTPTEQSSNVSETTSIGSDVTLGNDTQTESQSKLPDLVVNRNEHVQPVLPASNQAENSAITPANVGEFDFPALSSEEDNGGKITHTAGLEQTEVQLTEEEDDAVSALLSLSKSMPSDNSQDDLDNSELLPIGKKTVDVAPVPICLGTDDVNREIKKRMIPCATKGTDTLPDQTPDTEITTTIIANSDGSVVSTVSEQKHKPKLSSLPNLPKATNTPPDDSPGSPRGNFQLRSYKLKKKGTKSRKYACKSCNAVKDSVQELNDHHKRRHEQVMCGTCKKLFDAPLQLTTHMYEHYKKTLPCDRCDQCFTFQSELDRHKIIHRKTPTFKCTKANCNRWFFKNQDLNFHLETHKKTELKCPHCDKLNTNTDKYLKEHIKMSIASNCRTNVPNAKNNLCTYNNASNTWIPMTNNYLQ